MQTVHIIDGDSRVRNGLSRTLSNAGHETLTYPSAADFLENRPGPQVGCILLDLNLPDMDGIELQKALAADDGYLPLVFMTSDADVRRSVKAIKRGAIDVLTKPVDRSALLGAIETAINESRQNLCTHKRLQTLTPREYEVITYVISGLLNKQIAAKLDISEKTVKVHRARAFQKLKVESLAALVRLCDRVGVEPRR